MKILSPQDWQHYPGSFLALWSDDYYAYALYEPDELVAVPLADGGYPALNTKAALWFQRFDRDVTTHTATGASDQRPAIEQFRKQDGSAAWPEFISTADHEGYQVAVGPVHAAIIEPGHFRFSVIGEQVLKLEARFGYSHKGTLALMRDKSPRLAARFAARISGDATVAHSLAFAHAVEAALDIKVMPRAQYLRAIMAELERLANHAGDLGAIAADAGFPLLDSQLAPLREMVCAAAKTAFGHRLMMDMVVPGGVAGDLQDDGVTAITGALDHFDHSLPDIARVFATHAGLQDRLVGTGIISSALAAVYNPGGFVGRASGQVQDARALPGYPPYDLFGLSVPMESEGDVAARARIRLAEMVESCRLLRDFLFNLPGEEPSQPLPNGSGTGLGVAESFRGPVWYWLRIEGGIIKDIFIADPSTRHWPLLEYAATTSILADFPLINKSINASYAGVDL